MARPSTASTVKREGTRMKFMPGSQYTRGHSPSGGPIESQTATSGQQAVEDDVPLGPAAVPPAGRTAAALRVVPGARPKTSAAAASRSGR